MILQMEDIMFSKVAEFMRCFGQHVHEEPGLKNRPTVLRYHLIQEELEELNEALSKYENGFVDEKEALIEVADALTDILYVTLGAGHAFGIDLDACFEEVHSSNMSKLGPNGVPVRREDGKILKGPDFREPNLEPCIWK